MQLRTTFENKFCYFGGQFFCNFGRLLRINFVASLDDFWATSDDFLKRGIVARGRFFATSDNFLKLSFVARGRLFATSDDF